MPEGLSPIEAGKKLHEHGEQAERDEGSGDQGGGRTREERHSRIVCRSARPYCWHS